MRLLKELGNEMSILITVPLKDIRACRFAPSCGGRLTHAEGDINIMPGFDGEYGKVKIFDKADR